LLGRVGPASPPVSFAALNITVEMPSLEGSGQQDEFVNGLLGSAGNLLQNGDAEAVLVSVKGLSSVLNSASEARRRRRLRRHLLQVRNTTCYGQSLHPKYVDFFETRYETTR